MKRFFTRTVLFTALLFLAGCGGEDPVVPEPEQPGQPVQPENPDTPPPSEEEVSAFVPIDWEQTELRGFDAGTGEVTLTFQGGGTLPEFDDGHSVMVIETDTSAHIRRVMRSEADGATVRLQTVQANMTELFADTEFAVSLTPSAARTRTRTGGVTSIDEAGVLHPVKIVELNGDGTYRKLYDAKGQSRVDIGAESRIDIYNINLNGVVIASSDDGNMALSWESLKQRFSLKADAYFKFTKPVREEEVTEGLKVKLSELEACRLVFGAEVLSELILRADMKGEFSFALKDPVELAQFKPQVYKFITPSGIPVFFTLTSGLFADFTAEGSTENTARTGVSAEGKFNLGFEYTGNWKPIHEFFYDYNVYPFEISGKAEAGLKGWVYPQLQLKMYDFLGPSVEPSLYVRDEFKSGYFDQFGTAEQDYYTWNEKMFAGVDLQIALGLDFLGLEQTLTLVNENIVDKQFYNAPDAIKLVYPDTGANVTVGEAVPVRFNVTRKMLAADLPLALLPVKFVSEKGTVSQDFAITGPLGNADVEWTPEAEGATLTAQIFDADGEVLLEKVFAPEVEAAYEKWVTGSGKIVKDLNGNVVVEVYWEDVLRLYKNGTYLYTHNPDKIPLEWMHDGLPYNSLSHGYCKGKYWFLENPSRLVLELGQSVDLSTSNGNPIPGHIFSIKYIFGKNGAYDIIWGGNDDGSVNKDVMGIHFKDEQGRTSVIVFTKASDSARNMSRSTEKRIPVTLLTVDDVGNVLERSVEWRSR